MSRLVVSIGHVEFTGGSQVLYVVKVQQDVDEWEVRRTYSDFRKLRDDVQRVMKDARAHILDDACSRDFARELQDLPFPAKRLFGSRKDHVVKERAVELHRFLIKLLFLTHTYRKAQKARYDQYVQALPAHQQAAYAALQDRTQASVTVFYLLRDFLKPVTIKTDVSLQSGDLLGNSAGSGLDGGDAGDESDNSPKRLIRESKILAMRTSNASSERKKKNSGRSLLKEAEKMMQQERRKELQREQLRKEQHKYQQKQMPVAVPVSDTRSKPGAVLIEDPVRDELEAATHHQNNNQSSHKTASMTDLMAASARSQAEANSIRERMKQKQHSAPSLSESHRGHRHFSTPNEDDAEWKGRKARAVTAASTLSTITSSSTGSEPDKTIAQSSVPSSASSSASVDDVKLVDVSSIAKDSSKTTSRRGSHSSEKSSHKSRSKTRSKRKAKSAKNLQTETERMSRVSSQLNAQSISIHAQRELEKYLSEYSAIMILRYVDRFINKAVMKAPGCYRVNAQHKLVIDAQRFLEELELVFTDLPSNFGDMFHAGAPGDHDEWSLPKAMDKYVQMKWNSFQGMAMGSSSIASDNGNDHTVDHTSDSDDDSETEYEYEEVGGGGFMSAKQDFSNDEESMLQEMIANGTAGREQMLRLRRQNNERGWNRRENPGSRSRRVIEETSSSESEEETTARQKRRSNRREPKRSVSCVVEKYQQEQNARRKDRLSRVQSIGGFV
ncbi:hypothetical protein PHYBOEH_010195 [Phytophthora boehmeriae]|uniref:PX domain-containing protein n=1 Tax=Phytophthora boehmeriae TaxID=109152 RepID=A0A8T1X010_9STRA|nr:hypothetical protein PHYBOEH_010195 [Phytophthora boehmeriae]